MSDGIRLHPKHGVNPSLVVCFFCHKERGEIALLGSNGGREAPRHCIIDYEPCDACKEIMSKGIIMVEVLDTPATPDQRAIQNKYPTGRWAVVSEDFVKDFLTDGEPKTKVLQYKRAMVDKAAFDGMLAIFDELEAQQKLADATPAGHA